MLAGESSRGRGGGYTWFAILSPYFGDTQVINFNDLWVIYFSDGRIIKIWLAFCKKSVAVLGWLGKHCSR
jgi:hypothetical protein